MNTASTYSDYDSFAWFYNRYWGEDFARPVIGIYEMLLFPHLPDKARILDLCCGTGQLAAAMYLRGYQVTGVDGSPAMLEFARVNAPHVEFITADVRDLPPLRDFDATISAFDSLNHVMTLAELTQVFRHVYDAMTEQGIFLFDLNQETEEDARTQTFDVVEHDHACVVQATYDTQEKLKRYQVTMFHKNGQLWKRSDLVLEQRYYSETEVLSALAEAGFQQVRTYDARYEFDLQLSDGRMFFAARKSAPKESGTRKHLVPRVIA